MNYGEVLSKAWKIIWKNKILWLFGILASCGAINSMNNGGGGGGGASGASSQSNLWHGNGAGSHFLGVTQPGHFERMVANLAEVPWGVWVSIAIIVMMVIFVLVILIAVLRLFLGTLGTIGVIKGTSMADQLDPNEKPLSFGKIFNASKASYWKVLLFHLGYKVAETIVFLLFFLPLILLVVFTCGLGLILLLPIFWFIHQMLIFTTIAIIEDKLPIFEAIERAWQMITAHLGQVLVMFLILFIGRFFLVLLLVLPLFVMLILPLLLSLLITGGEIALAGIIISSILFLGFIAMMILLSGVIQAYILASWTLTYRRLALEEDMAVQILSRDDQGTLEDD